MIRSYLTEKIVGTLDQYSPFPYPYMPEEQKEQWGIDLDSMTWVFVGYPE